MSFAIEWRERARRAFSRLDIPVQELVLDGVERMAAGGGLLPGRPLPLAAEFDVRLETSDRVHYAFVRVQYDDPTRTLLVDRLDYFGRPA